MSSSSSVSSSYYVFSFFEVPSVSFFKVVYLLRMVTVYIDTSSSVFSDCTQFLKDYNEWRSLQLLSTYVNTTQQSTSYLRSTLVEFFRLKYHLTLHSDIDLPLHSRSLKNFPTLFKLYKNTTILVDNLFLHSYNQRFNLINYYKWICFYINGFM